MKAKSEKILEQLAKAKSENAILESAAQNIENWLNAEFLPDWALDSLDELFSARLFEEINDRFFRAMAFGTGGMRGKTIAKNPTKSELGTPSEQGTPAHAAVGANNMNDFVVARATLGLFNYCAKYLAGNGGGVPSLAIAYDVRHFSKHFCELSASVWSACGGKVYIFNSPRSTPQLSFTVRHLKTTAGVVITASHNPASDNGYKVYFSDGAQVINPHTDGIVAEVEKVEWKDVAKLLNVDLSKVEYVAKSAEDAYISSIENCVIDKEVMAQNKPKIVFTPVHGTGAALCPTIMRHFGLDPILVEAQMQFDPRFPTVKQPNPEYAETLEMGLKTARDSNADCLVATDPDADRMGAAIRTKSGEWKLITGNMIGSLLAEYRISQMERKGIITNPKNCAFVKTFVTTPLQDSIAREHGIKCINALTGFKWIGGRLTNYEKQLEKALGKSSEDLPYLERAKLMQEHSTFFVFGGEESYGYLGTDSVRDKDANAAVIMFSEMLAWLKSQNKTVDEYLDEIYLKCGYYLESLRSIYREGAAGATTIQNFLKKLAESPMQEVGGVKVAKAINFASDKIIDADGCQVPKENFFFYTLENDYSFAIRASGTEPKIKFYAFAKENAKTLDELADAKIRAREKLDAMLDDLELKFDNA